MSGHWFGDGIQRNLVALECPFFSATHGHGMQDKLLKNTSDPRFKIFHDLMPHKIRRILLVSRQYDAWIMEEGCRLSERIIKEYKGLNLSHPPRLRWASDAANAIRAIARQSFDLIIIIAREADKFSQETAAALKAECRGIPVILMVHHAYPVSGRVGLPNPTIDGTFLWTGNTDVLFAIIKSTEDWMNAKADTALAGIRIILFVEDSPEYNSTVLPILFKELVKQAQAVMEESLNDEHRLLAMQTYEIFKDNILGVISDVRFPRKGSLDKAAGIRFLKRVKFDRFDIPLLLISSENENRPCAESIPSRFVDKNSPSLPSDIRYYFKEDLGFGDFVFRAPNGRVIGRATHLRALEQQIVNLPEESFQFHCRRNDFYRWLFARSEIELAAKVRTIRDADFSDAQSHCEHLRDIIHQRRMQRQKGIVIDFDAKYLDQDFEFCEIGSGSLGGKARGLAFMNTLLHQNQALRENHPSVSIGIPQTLVITTEGFEDFIEDNDLRELAKVELSDDEIAKRFVAAKLPALLVDQLRADLSDYRYPLSIRSSSLLEDAQYRAYAGLYNTYMLANDHDDIACRLEELCIAVKLVYASTYFSGPKAFSRRVCHRTEEEEMAIIVQKLMGSRHGSYFYPAISGVAQSYNYYPFAQMAPEDGVVTIALGLGKAVMGGESSLRFSPKHPRLLPDRSTVADQVKNAQRFFYSLSLASGVCRLGVDDGATLKRREITDAINETPIRLLTSTYYPEDNRIRDAYSSVGIPVATFHPFLKYNSIPLASLLNDLLRIRQQAMGTPVEIEFCVNLNTNAKTVAAFTILQLRPMGACEEFISIDISETEQKRAFVSALHSLGNTVDTTMQDIVYVKPSDFDPATTKKVAAEITQMNAKLCRQGKKYLLIGPGRWGSADQWLGIPVQWEDIRGVGAIVEADYARLQAEPSQVPFFFTTSPQWESIT
jgi:hypothetical protein